MSFWRNSKLTLERRTISARLAVEYITGLNEHFEDSFSRDRSRTGDIAPNLDLLTPIRRLELHPTRRVEVLNFVTLYNKHTYTK